MLHNNCQEYRRNLQIYFTYIVIVRNTDIKDSIVLLCIICEENRSRLGSFLKCTKVSLGLLVFLYLRNRRPKLYHSYYQTRFSRHGNESINQHGKMYICPIRTTRIEFMTQMLSNLAQYFNENTSYPTSIHVRSR